MTPVVDSWDGTGQSTAGTNLDLTYDVACLTADSATPDAAGGLASDLDLLTPEVALALMPRAAAFLLDGLKQTCEAVLLRVVDEGALRGGAACREASGRGRDIG